MNLKIRQAQLAKIPYMLIVGDKETASSKVSVRLRSGEDLGSQSPADAEARIIASVEAKV